MYDITTVVPDGEMLQQVFDMLQKGVVKAVIDKVYSLDQLATAHDYLSKGHASGKVIVELPQ